MALVSWAKKELARLRNSPKRLLPPKTSLNTKHIVPSQVMQNEITEVELAADLRCIRCRERVATMVSADANINDLESILVHVAEKKVTITRKRISH